jgi:hypothetical protein
MPSCSFSEIFFGYSHRSEAAADQRQQLQQQLSIDVIIVKRKSMCGGFAEVLTQQITNKIWSPNPQSVTNY